MTVPAAMVVPLPIEASGPITAPGSTVTPSSRRALGSTCRTGRRHRSAQPWLQGVGIEQRKHLGEAAIGLGHDEGGRARRRLPREFRSDETGLGAVVGKEREIFRVVEERQVPLPRGIERAHILDLSVEIGVAGRRRAGGLAHGAQGKWASTLEKAWMFHRVSPKGAPNIG